MNNLILQPQLPIKMRYQEWWYSQFPNKLSLYFDNILSLGGNNCDIVSNNNKQLFSPVEQSIQFELKQISEYLKINNNDYSTLFCLDLSFPGFFCNVLHHKPFKNSYCFIHGSSQNKFDYFEPVRDSKWLVESGHSRMFDKIFVGSKYHADKLKWRNVEVVGLPKPPFITYREEKIYDVISVARPCVQKVNSMVEDRVNVKWPIIRKDCNSWGDYYKFLSQAKILLISAKEDTFNYSIVEAIMNNTIVLAPNRCSYPELLPPEYIWQNVFDLQEKIEYYLDHYTEVPKLLNQNLIDNFYDNVINIMQK